MRANQPCIKSEALIGKLRELGYTFQEQKKRVALWRKRGGSHFVAVPRSNWLAQGYVESTLRQCGVPEAEIIRFVSETRRRPE